MISNEEKEILEERRINKKLKEYYSIKEEIQNESLKKLINFKYASSLGVLIKSNKSDDLVNTRLNALKDCFKSIKKEKALKERLEELKNNSIIKKNVLKK